MRTAPSGTDTATQRCTSSRKSRSSPNVAIFRFPLLLLPLISLFSIFSALEAPFASYPRVCEAATGDASASTATSDNEAFERGRRLGERLHSNSLANNKDKKRNRTFLSPPNRTTSTVHDRAMYHLIKDMKPILPPEDIVDEDIDVASSRSLLAHDDPSVTADYVMDTIGFSVRGLFCFKFC